VTVPDSRDSKRENKVAILFCLTMLINQTFDQNECWPSSRLLHRLCKPPYTGRFQISQSDCPHKRGCSCLCRYRVLEYSKTRNRAVNGSQSQLTVQLPGKSSFFARGPSTEPTHTPSKRPVLSLSSSLTGPLAQAASVIATHTSMEEVVRLTERFMFNG